MAIKTWSSTQKRTGELQFWLPQRGNFYGPISTAESILLLGETHALERQVSDNESCSIVRIE